MKKEQKPIQEWKGQTTGYVVHPQSLDLIPCMKHSRFYGNFPYFENYNDACKFANERFDIVYPNGRIIIADKF